MTTDNPLLADLADNQPRVSVTLPTMGLFYDNSIVDKSINFEDAPVSSFTIWQESLFSDPYTIISGRATTDMIQRVAPWVHRPLDLARIDVETIMIGARLASYGEKMELEIECSNPATNMVEDAKVKKVEGKVVPLVEQKVCGAKSPVKIDVRDLMGMYPAMDGIKKWSLKIGGQTVLLRPPRVKDEFEIAKTMVAQAKRLASVGRTAPETEAAADALLEQLRGEVNEAQIGAVYRQIKSSIAAVKTSNGTEVRDEAQIMEWLSAMSGSSMMAIRDKIKVLLAPYDKAGMFDFQCPLCAHVTKDVPIVSSPEYFFTGGLGRQ